MRTIKAVITLAMVLLLAHTVSGEDGKKSAPPLTWSTTMPAIEISKQPLEKVLNDLETKLPGFDFSISRENVPHDYPVLPAMSVENVSLQQFFDLVQAEVPGVSISFAWLSQAQGVTPSQPGWDLSSGKWIDSTPFCVVNVVPNPNAAATTQPTVVRVFGLAELIAYRSVAIEGVEKREDREKQASNEILSMIQAALDVAGDPAVPVMKMHEPTKTLIFKGTDAQAQIVESAIKALHTGDGTAINLERDKISQLNLEVQKLLAEGRQLNDLNTELVAKSHNPATKPSK